LLRCVASSPAAAAKALNIRMEGKTARFGSTDKDDLHSNDLEPAGQLDEIHASLQGRTRLTALIPEAQRLSGKAGDPTLAALMAHMEGLV
jgi:hypothetical protein